MNFKTADVKGVRVFYREAGDPSKPTIVLLHGFPSSSFQFHDLIPPLADRFYVIAPDYPGMGFSDAPAPTILRPTFDDVTEVIDVFIAQRSPGPVILYMHDIGGPIGMRIATADPERIAGLIFQNFTISVEGWNPARLKVYERLGGPETAEKLAETEQFVTVERDMFRTAFLKDRQPKALILWGRNDPLFSPAAPEALKQALPKAEVHYFDGGHFVLDEYANPIADEIIETFSQ